MKFSIFSADDSLAMLKILDKFSSSSCADILTSFATTKWVGSRGNMPRFFLISSSPVDHAPAFSPLIPIVECCKSSNSIQGRSIATLRILKDSVRFEVSLVRVFSLFEVLEPLASRDEKRPLKLESMWSLFVTLLNVSCLLSYSSSCFISIYSIIILILLLLFTLVTYII